MFSKVSKQAEKQISLSCASGDVTTPGSQGPGCNWTGVKGRTRPTWWFVGSLRYSVGGFPNHMDDDRGYMDEDWAALCVDEHLEVGQGYGKWCIMIYPLVN